jgi:transmembrane 9 superfamily protein 1
VQIDSIPHTHEILLGTHHHFSIEYNGDKIITANVTVSDYTTRLPDDAETPRAMEVTYTYSVAWSKTRYG